METTTLQRPPSSRRGRPSKAEADKRQERLNIKVTPSELRFLQTLSDLHSKSITQVIVDGARALLAADIADAIRAAALHTATSNADFAYWPDVTILDMPDMLNGHVIQTNDYERAIRAAAEVMAAQHDGDVKTFDAPKVVVFSLLQRDASTKSSVSRLLFYGQSCVVGEAQQSIDFVPTTKETE
jgi:uncharacterized protein (DUF1778 family)